MQKEYLKEQIVREKNEDEINQEIIKSLIEAKQELNNSHNNLKFADPELTDYYSYRIKAAKSKIDYLVKLAKTKKLSSDMIKAINYSIPRGNAI